MLVFFAHSLYDLNKFPVAPCCPVLWLSMRSCFLRKVKQRKNNLDTHAHVIAKNRTSIGPDFCNSRVKNLRPCNMNPTLQMLQTHILVCSVGFVASLLGNSRAALTGDKRLEVLILYRWFLQMWVVTSSQNRLSLRSSSL